MIRAFLAFLEARGAGEVLAGELAEALASDGPDARAALVAEGVIRAGSLATTHACDGLDCAREVREREPGKDGARRFLAVCTRSPRECETVHLAEAQLAQDAIALDAFFATVRRALRIEAPLDDWSARQGRGALTGAGEPVLLGEQVVDGRGRDVFFARKPGAPALRVLLAERRSMPRGTLVLVPTARGIESALLARHGGGHVEIAVLADLLIVQRGKIAAASRLRVVRPAGAEGAGDDAAPESANARPAKQRRAARLPIEGLPPAKRWGEISFFSVEKEGAIGIEIEHRSRILSAAELGMTVGRTGEPLRAFVLLRRICDGNGIFDTRPWGGRENGKQIVSELRAALAAVFPIVESPIESYSRAAKSWKTRFRAFAGKPSEVRALDRMLLGAEKSEKSAKRRKE